MWCVGEMKHGQSGWLRVNEGEVGRKQGQRASRLLSVQALRSRTFWTGCTYRQGQDGEQRGQRSN